MWVLWTYSRRACGLVGISCGGYSGIYICGETNSTIVLLGKNKLQYKSVVLTADVRFSRFCVLLSSHEKIGVLYVRKKLGVIAG